MQKSMEGEESKMKTHNIPEWCESECCYNKPTEMVIMDGLFVFLCVQCRVRVFREKAENEKLRRKNAKLKYVEENINKDSNEELPF